MTSSPVINARFADAGDARRIMRALETVQAGGLDFGGHAARAIAARGVG